MLLFLADEDLHNGNVRGLNRRQPRVEVVRVQDVGLSGRDDNTVLEWAAQYERIVIHTTPRPWFSTRTKESWKAKECPDSS